MQGKLAMNQDDSRDKNEDFQCVKVIISSNIQGPFYREFEG